MSNNSVDGGGSTGVNHSSQESKILQEPTPTWGPLLERLELRISEGWVSVCPHNQSPPVNAFGRKVNIPENLEDPVDYLSGLSLNGLRAASLIDSYEALRQFAGITLAATKMLSWVQYLQQTPRQGADAISCLKAGNGLSDSGVFQLVSGSAQEALDFGAIAHRVAELALSPGLVLLDGTPDPTHMAALEVPDTGKLRKFLGDPDDRIDCVTPFQQMVFGKTRRRIPNWFSFDHPTFHGPLKTSSSAALEIAARGPFLLDHLHPLMMQALEEFARIFGRQYHPVEKIAGDDAELLIIVQGSIGDDIRSAIAELRGKSGNKIGLLRIRMLRPFPGHMLAQMLAGKKAVTVLERTMHTVSENPLLLRDVAFALNKAEENSRFDQIPHPGFPKLAPNQKPLLFSGVYGLAGGSLTCNEVTAVYENMRNAFPGKSSFFGSRQEIKPQFRTHFTLGIDFFQYNSPYPKLEVESNQVRNHYPDLVRQTLSELPDSADHISQSPETKEAAASSSTDLPLAVRSYRDEGPPYTRLSRFYNHTALLYQNQDEEQQTASPWQCVPSVPMATAGLRDHSGERELLPQFDPVLCSGCGQCFIHCPHSAIPPSVASPETLLRTAVEAASSLGTPLSQITPALKGLSQIIGKELRDRKEPLLDLAEVMPPAFERLISQMKPEGERKSALEKELQVVLEILKKYPLSITDTFFQNAEKHKRGTGELFSLSIDPHLCTGCGICAGKCEEDALRMEEQTAETLDSLKSRFKFWEALPDTSAVTLKRVLDDPDYPSLGAVLLSRHYSMSMRGGESSGTDATEQTLLHLVTSVTESLMQPAVLGLAGEVEKLKEKLTTSIRDFLSECLGDDHFAVLAKTLSSEPGRRLPYDELIQKVSDETPSSLVDLDSLRRKLELEQSLHDLHWVIHEGPSGVGRSRLGMMLQGGSAMGWAKHHPFHPFGFPVVLQWTPGVSDMGLGILQGHLRHFLDNIRLIRRAVLESKGKYEPQRDDPAIASLGWKDLSEEERLAFPPLLLAATYDTIDERNVSKLSALLASGLPVKILLLDTLRNSANRSPENYARMRSKLALGAMTHKHAFVLQSSLATPEHLYAGLAEGIRRQGPALFHLHAPPADEDPRPALEARVFPAMRFDPALDGTFGVLLDLDGNPFLKQTWALDPEDSRPEDEEQAVPTLTFADWALSRVEFREHFMPTEGDESGLIPLHEFLEMEESEQQGNIPFVAGKMEEGARPAFRVSESMLNASRIIMEHWLLLQELNGTRTPFTEKIRTELQQSLESQHQAELDQLRDEYEQRLVNSETEMLQKTREKIRERLLQLSKKKAEPVS